MTRPSVRVRIIPCLLLDGSSLVKTVRFRNPTYIGDPANTVRIFNELEVDELCVLDIRATKERRSPNFELLEEIASEAFMPLSYGGGVRDRETVGRLLRIGFEKVVINTALEDGDVVRQAAEAYGKQAVVASVDVRKKLLGRYEVMIEAGSRGTSQDPVTWARRAESLGAGEILLTSIDREGTWSGFDTSLISSITHAVSVPVIAHGGAGNIRDIGDAVRIGGASAVALGSMVVFQGKELGVLVSFPEPADLDAATGRTW